MHMEETPAVNVMLYKWNIVLFPFIAETKVIFIYFIVLYFYFDLFSRLRFKCLDLSLIDMDYRIGREIQKQDFGAVINTESLTDIFSLFISTMTSFKKQNSWSVTD